MLRNRISLSCNKRVPQCRQCQMQMCVTVVLFPSLWTDLFPQLPVNIQKRTGTSPSCSSLIALWTHQRMPQPWVPYEMVELSNASLWQHFCAISSTNTVSDYLPVSQYSVYFPLKRGFVIPWFHSILCSAAQFIAAGSAGNAAGPSLSELSLLSCYWDGGYLDKEDISHHFGKC